MTPNTFRDRKLFTVSIATDTFSNKLVIILFILLLFAHCQRKDFQGSDNSSRKTITTISTEVDSIPKSIDADCHITGPVISHAEDFEGLVTFRGDSELYSITYAVPNTGDTELIGYACNMPVRFKKPGSRVKFSGDYYHAYKYLQKAHAGESVLYLYLTSIEQVK